MGNWRRHSREFKQQVVERMKTSDNLHELARELGVSEATLYTWKSKYGGMEVNEARRLKALEEENGRLKKIVAQQALDLDALKAVLSKKW